ncbi:MAG: hypothetical protein FWH12_07195 [Treponema sp.]|nr:hypothetical protein [Treponema sp.]
METISEPTWDELKGVELTADKKQYSNLNILREDLISAENQFVSKFQMVSVKSPVQNTFTNYGEVSKDRPLITYIDAVDWLNDQLSKINLPTKLLISNLEGDGKALFQHYLFNEDMETPDGLAVYPSIILRSSIIGPRPALEVHFGAYRVICANGMVASHPGVKSSFFAVTPKNWKGLKNLDMRSFIHRSFDSLGNMSRRYNELNDSSLSEKKDDIFSEKQLPLSLRKNVISILEHSGHVDVNIKTNKKREPLMKASHLKEHHLSGEFIQDTVVLRDDTSLWSVYNYFTNTVSSANLLSSKFISDSQRIHETFIKTKQS